MGYILTAGAALAIGSAASLALQSPADAQIAQDSNKAPQNAPSTMPSVGPGGAPRSFADLAARLQPAVVNISTTQEIEVGRFPGIPRVAPGTPLEELFRRFQEQQEQGGEPVTREANSLGSGFVIDPSGYIVTNNHVITGRNGSDPVDTITVTLSDRREFQARIVGRDPLSDLALLKIDAQNLPYVRFGNSEQVRVGDWVVAIGNPFGLGGSVTAGIVSALHRDLNAGAYDRYIQTDASINMGNSGGPMFDLEGNVVGINTAIYSPSGGNVGIGFAIPSEQAQPVIEQLRASGRVRRGFLGVGIQPVSDEIAAALGLPEDRGAIVANVEPGGPAARGGVQRGDVIIKIDGKEVTPDNSLTRIVAETQIGKRVPIEFVRNNKRQTVQVVIGERPAEQQLAGTPSSEPEDTNGTTPGEQAARQSLGVSLQELTPEIRRQLRLPADVQGVVIAGLNPNSDAARQGLARGNVIISINQQTVRTPQDAATIVEAARKAGRNAVALLVQRGTNPPVYLGVKLMGASGHSSPSSGN